MILYFKLFGLRVMDYIIVSLCFGGKWQFFLILPKNIFHFTAKDKNFESSCTFEKSIKNWCHERLYLMTRKIGVFYRATFLESRIVEKLDIVDFCWVTDKSTISRVDCTFLHKKKMDSETCFKLEFPEL